MTTVTTPIEAAPEVVAPAGRAAVIVGALAAAALAVMSITSVEGDIVAATWVRAGLVAAWALAAMVLASRGATRIGGVAVAIALAGGACAATATEPDLDWLHVLAASLIPATALHLELTIPNGRAGKATRRNAIIAGYVIAAAVGVALGAGSRMPSAAVVAAATVGTLLLGLPAAHHIYMRSTGLDRQRLQLIGCAVAIVIEVALVVAALRLLVEWPTLAAQAPPRRPRSSRSR